MFEDFATCPKNMSTHDAMQHFAVGCGGLARARVRATNLTWPFGGESSTVSRAAEAATGFLPPAGMLRTSPSRLPARQPDSASAPFQPEPRDLDVVDQIVHMQYRMCDIKEKPAA